MKRGTKNIWQLFAIIFLCVLESVLVFFTVVSLIAFPLIGIVLLVLCGMLMFGIIKLCKRYREPNPQNVKAENIREKRTVYAFISPFPLSETMCLLRKTVERVGWIQKVIDGYIFGKLSINRIVNVKIEFFVERGTNSCKVRCVVYSGWTFISPKDQWWDKFLCALFAEAPDADFGIAVSNGNPYLIGAVLLGDELEQIRTSVSYGGTALLQLLIGDTFFGTVLDGITTPKHTLAKTKTQFANQQLARLMYSNGRLFEGAVRKNSKLYNEIMVNMQS